MIIKSKTMNNISLMLLTSSVLMFFLMLILCYHFFTLIIEFEFSLTNSSTFLFSMVFDWMSVLFFFFVSLISSSVIFYANYYMDNEPLPKLFIILVFLFVMSMFFLVFSLNLISIILGWDGLGLTSFLLVIYYQNNTSNAAGMITALSNRVGDSSLLISIALLAETSSWNILLMNNNNFNYLLPPMIMLTAITKSAQIPFSAWLPAAMSAPTPVSALVHSSTLVTAGVYILIRFKPILFPEKISINLFIIGLMTCLMASMSACMETDFKKIVALSTLSQLGLMVMTLSLNFITMAFLHLLIHAVFKALLFMASGKIIHETSSNQDIRHMGSMMINLPYTSLMMNTANLSLCGIPFMTGFYSKDLIFETFLMNNYPLSITILFASTIGLSTTYSLRFAHLSMMNPNSQHSLFNKAKEELLSMKSMFPLFISSIIFGSMFTWLLLSHPQPVILPLLLKILAMIMVMSGIVTGLLISMTPMNPLSKLAFYLEGFNTMWFLPSLSGKILSFMTLSNSTKMKHMEMGWAEFLGGQGSFNSLMSYSHLVSTTQKNSIHSFLTICGLMIIFIPMW